MLADNSLPCNPAQLDVELDDVSMREGDGSGTFRTVASTTRLPQGVGVQRNTDTQFGNMGMDQITVGNGALVQLSGCVYLCPHPANSCLVLR